jgi:hypothetical protein
MANGLVNLMRDLANSGKTIICTIHQPSTQTFKKFDTFVNFIQILLKWLSNLLF